MSGKNKHKQAGETARYARRRRKRRRRGGNNILWYLLIGIVMAGVTVFLTTTVLFKIENISVTGCTRYQEREIILSSGIMLKENMFRLNGKEIEKKLVDEYSYIKSVDLHRKLPDTVILQVTEAEPAGAVDAGAGYTLISAEGRVLECNTPVLPEGLQVVLGFSKDPLKEGEYLNEEDTANAQRMFKTVQAAQESGFTAYDAIDLSDPYNIRLYYKEQFEIILGTDSDLAYKLELVKKVIDEQDLLNTFRGTIDASYDGSVWTRPSGSAVLPQSERQDGENPEQSEGQPETQQETGTGSGSQTQDEPGTVPDEESGRQPPPDEVESSSSSQEE